MLSIVPFGLPVLVALLAEGVDRNFSRGTVTVGFRRSPSSRRAWIEIDSFDAGNAVNRSPSSRRAWIEIVTPSITTPIET